MDHKRKWQDIHDEDSEDDMQSVDLQSGEESSEEEDLDSTSELEEFLELFIEKVSERLKSNITKVHKVLDKALPTGHQFLEYQKLHSRILLLLSLLPRNSVLLQDSPKGRQEAVALVMKYLSDTCG